VVEKRGEAKETDVRKLMKRADMDEVTICYNMSEYLDKPALLVVATGPRAKKLEELIEKAD